MTIPLVVLGLIGILVLLVLWGTSDNRKYPGEKRAKNKLYLYWAFLPLFIVILGLAVGSFVTVPAGERGVLLRFGKVVGVLDEGLNLKVPVIDSVERMSVKTQLFEAKAQSASKDLQDVETTVAVNYKVKPEEVGNIYRTIGTDYIDKIAHPIVQETVKAISAEYNAEDMILKRSAVKQEITEILTQRLAERGIIAESVAITNFEFSEEFTKAIEAKVVAVQKVLEAENTLKQVEVEARQAEQKAKGEAAANIAAAQGEAQAITIVTEAQVSANNAIRDSLTPEVLQYILIDRLGEDIKVVVIPQGQDFTLGDIAE
jgi:regulator of protease activity HflC (stomatin/prohibitin superfamily)